MKKISIFILFIISGIACYAQSPDDMLIPGKIDIRFLEHLVKLQIDSVRIAHGLSPLINDPILYDAAKDHAKYLSPKGELCHFQPENKNKVTPQDRIVFYGAKDMYAGENVILSYILINTVDKHLKNATPHIASTYRQAAFDIMTGWVNSPKHFANIITKDYYVTGVALEYNRKTNAIMGVQDFATVLSRKTYVVQPDKDKFPYSHLNEDSLRKISRSSKLLTHKKHAWNLRKQKTEKDNKRCDECKKLYAKKDDLYLMNMNDSIYFFFDNKPLFKKVFKKRRDGLAVEIVNFKDYECGSETYYTKPSRRNGLCIYNGKVNKPVYKKELYGKRISDKASKHDILVNMGRKPDDLDPENYEINMLVIKKKRICDVITFTGACGQLFEYIPDEIPYVTKLPATTIKPYVKPDTINLIVYFEKNKWDFDVDVLKPAIALIEKKNYEVINAHITAFASVEGFEDMNEELYNKRAKAIVSVLEKKQSSEIPIKLTMKENWAMFFQQIKKTKWDSLAGKDTNEIRKFVNLPVNNDEMEPLFKKERYAKVKLIARLKLTEENIDSLAYADLTSTLLKEVLKLAKNKKKEGQAKKTMQNVERINRLQLLLYERFINGKIKDSLYAQFDIPKMKMFDKMLLNRAFFRYNTTNDENKDHLMFDDLYALVAMKSTESNTMYNYVAFLINHCNDNNYSQFLNAEQIKKFISILAARKFDKEKLAQLELFYHFRFANECYWKGTLSKAKPSVLYIYNYYKPKKISDDFAIKLAKYFIVFSKFTYAIDFLKPIIDRENPNHEALTIYLKLIYYRISSKQVSDYYQELVDAAEVLNQQEWCGLFRGRCNISFQIFDYEPLWNLYCTKCHQEENKN